MLELTFFKKQSNPEIISVSEHCYERLANIGLDKKIEYRDRSLRVEGEEYSINSAELTEENRVILLTLIEIERQEALEKIFLQMDKNPSIKEMREMLWYIKELTTIYKAFKAEDSTYFSYD